MRADLTFDPALSHLPVRGGAGTYWSEIDGLRTLAVLAVVVFHLDNTLLAGGFAGVDVFFAISGFLIAEVLLRRRDQHGFEILWFYQRRIARIAPASLFTIAATLVGGYFLFSAPDFALLGSMGATAALSTINIKLLLQGSYFEVASDSQPLIHFWSLALEEQLYLIFPLIFTVIVERARRPLLAISMVAGASFIASILATPQFPTAAFYLLPTRAWEFLAGSALALWRRGRPLIGEGRAGVLFPIGTAILCASFLMASSEDWPGWRAAIPVSGALLALASLGPGVGITRRILASAPMTAIGRRSYSLYLWHWPIFSFVDYGLFQEPATVRTFLKVTLTIVATAVSYAVVERPSRVWLGQKRHRRLTFLAFAMVAMALGAGGLLIRHHYSLDATGRVASGGVVANRSGERGDVVLVGDSLASMYGYELASLARSMNFRLNVLSISGGNELPGERATRWPEVRGFLDRNHPTVVILGQLWTEKLGRNGRGELAGAIAAILQRARYVVVLTEPPPAPANATREGIRAGARPPYFPDPAESARRDATSAMIRSLAGPRVFVLDTSDALLKPDGSLVAVNDRGRLVYSDRNHLTDAGTSLERARLAAVLSPLLGHPRPWPRDRPSLPVRPIRAR